MRFFLLFLYLLPNLGVTSEVSDFLIDSGVSIKNFEQVRLLKKFKTSSSLGKHFIFTAEDADKNIYDVDFHLGIPVDLATRSISNLTNLLKIAYGDKPSPYAGEITNVEKCPLEFQPKFVSEVINGKNMGYYISSAGSRYQYGACDSKTVVYQVCTSLYYEPKNQLMIKLKYFVPKSNANCGLGVKKFYEGLGIK
jgi:hypothetical protein